MELLTRSSLLIANPAARRAPALLERAKREFAAAGRELVVRLTGAAGDARLIAEAEGSAHSAVFALGGDGTVMEVVDALAHTGLPVGVIPGGTGNLIARALGIPLRVGPAIRALLEGDLADVDLGRIDDSRRFAFAAGVGIDARMIHETSPALKRSMGVNAYALTAARASLEPQDFALRVEVDGEVIERQAAGMMIANFGTVLDRLITLGPGIRQDDGRLDLCVFSPRDSWETLGVAWRLFRADFTEHPALLFRAGSRFRVECDPPQLFQADGEIIGSTPFDVVVEPHAARLILPKVRATAQPVTA